MLNIEYEWYSASENKENLKIEVSRAPSKCST